MYLPVAPQPSCAQAWLAAARAVDARPGHEAHNVIVGVDDPLAESAADQAIIAEVDALLRAHALPVQSVANTIFPQATYDRHGAPEFYLTYLKQVHPRVMKRNDWGRYFERMISWPALKKGEQINPLQDIIDKMGRQVAAERVYGNTFELTVYDPIRDAGPVMNRQCLSFLSFKLEDGAQPKVRLTAMYRNHYYTQRLLGNLIGLGRLMKFVADQVGAGVGDLTIVSTHAQVDTVGSRAEIAGLLQRCDALRDVEAERQAA